jgi:hypothetical protein
MKRILVYAILASTVLLLAVMLAEFGFTQATKVQAQEQSYRVVSIKIKSGMGPEWENCMKSELIPILRKSGVTEYQTWTTEFGDPDEYVMLMPLKNMSELDGPGPLAAAGKDGIAVLMARLQQMVNSAHFSVITSRNILSIAAKPGYVPKLGVLLTNTVAIGHEEGFAKSLKAVLAVMEKTNVKGLMTSKLAFGGNPNEFYTFIMFDSFADMENSMQAIRQALGEAKLAPQTGIVTQRENAILKYVSELSIQPAAP